MSYFEREWPNRLYTGKEDYQYVLAGTDVKTTQTTTIKAGESSKLSVLITPENFPAFEVITLDKINGLMVAVRSQLAQRGGDINDYLVEQLLRKVKAEHLSYEGRFNTSYKLEADFRNWSQRDITILENTGVFSLVSWNTSHNLLKGFGLISAIEGDNPLIYISGEKGVDWTYMYHPVGSEIIGKAFGENQPKYVAIYFAKAE